MLKTEVTFFYPCGSTLTGQELASKLILELLVDGNYRFKTVKLPVFERSKRWSIVYMFCFLAQIAYVWWRFLALSFKCQAVVYLNLGQSFKALVCDGLPFFLCSFFNPGVKCVISLHGHFFCTWQAHDLRLRLFIRILRRASLIVVLGPCQREKLIELGIPGSYVHIVNNTCECTIQTGQKSAKKKGRINLLYLSNLIEAKGYKEYLLALLHLSSMVDCPLRIRAVLCGKLTATSLDSSNANSDDEAWIQQTIETINKSCFIEVTWVQGAYGWDKAALFCDADIFVYLSRVEAHPIVLIEAMATGCAIIASDVGEIPTMLDSNAGLVLHNCSAELLAKSILELINDGMKRNELKRAALSKYESKFSRQAYAANWQDIFIDLCKRCGEEFV